MTVVSSCLACGEHIPLGETYCNDHQPVPKARRLRGGGFTIKRFREVAFRLAGGRCEAVVDGARCEERRPEFLEAHHVIPVEQGGSNDPRTNALLLCRVHHRAVERRTREAAQ